MALSVSEAKESDASRIADIHMAAFGENVMLLAQFPTPAVRSGLWRSLVKKTVEEIRDPKLVVLVAKDHTDHIIAFAKWCLPIYESENYVEAPWIWPDGTDMNVLNEWVKIVENAGQRILGSTPCYRLSFIATDPNYERQGAASLLIQWGLDRCKAGNVPAALESTLNAAPLYERLGFKQEERISMAVHGIGDEGVSMIYEEICYVFRPDRDSGCTENRTQRHALN